jgi:AcrR family transcriptional regulator
MEQDPPRASRRPRSDSLKNRERLIAAAREVFAEGGASASLEAVARRAGVGIGTLYRHFPARDALFQAVYRSEVDQLVSMAEARASDADPAAALRHWLHANIGVMATKRGMLVALAPTPEGSKELFADSRARLVAAVGALMTRAQAAGAIRGDLEAEEVLMALYGICSTRDGPGWQAGVVRLVDVFVDGMAAPDLSGRESG